jgi:hypothetical protein
MRGARLSVWLTATAGVLMVFTRSDGAGILLRPTGEIYPTPSEAMRAGWAMISPDPIDCWRPFRGGGA